MMQDKIDTKQLAKDKKRLYNQKYRLEHLDDIHRKAREYASKHKKMANKRGSEWYKRNRERVLQSYLQLKHEVLTHYGNGKCVCVRCGFDNIRALSIDHINGGGTKQRVEAKLYGGVSLYRWLRKEHYPLGYQTLCLNCQFIKRSENEEHKWAAFARVGHKKIC